jgi:hypothetical protein
MPNTTDVGTLFQDDKVGEVGLLQRVSSSNPGHAGTDDDDSRLPPNIFRGIRVSMCSGQSGSPITLIDM